VASTYFAEGLPYSIVRQISSQYFTAMGASLAAIGNTSLLGLAWNAKLLWAPLLERYGTRRRWLWAFEAILGLLVLAMAGPAGARDLPSVWKMLVAAAFLAATHDIAVDGFYLEALEKKAQTELSGLRVAAYRAAMLTGNGLLVVLAGRTSWRTCFLVAGGLLLLLAAVHAAMLPAPAAAESTRAASTEGNEGARPAGRAYVEGFTSFLRQPRIGASLAFIALYNAGDQLMFNMSAPFLRDLGLGTELRGRVGTVGTLASITGSMVGSAAVARFGLRRLMTPIAVGQSLAIVAYVALSVSRLGTLAVGAVAVFEQLAAGVGGSVFVVFLMRRCAKEHRAVHFAIASSLMSIVATGAGPTAGYLAGRLGYPLFFAVAFAASLPGVALTFLVPHE
jgi:PAT family beta-lactamase induction signal transducer AmpG